MDDKVERAIASLCSAQLGLITRPQARRLGLTKDSIARRVRTHQLVPIGNRLLRVAAAPDHDHADVLAACLDVGGVASHRTAAWIHQLDGFGERSIVEVTVQKGRRATRTPLGLIHTTTSWADDTMRVGRVPVMSVARTLLDLGALMPRQVSRQRLVGAIESAVRDRKATEPWLWWLLEKRRVSGRNGVRELESALADRAQLGPTESWLERETLRLLAEAGFPRPEVQQSIPADGRFVSRVDFLYSDQRVVIEVDGAMHGHTRQRGIDARQTNELQFLGFQVLRFTYEQIVHDPFAFISDVACALGCPLAA